MLFGSVGSLMKINKLLIIINAKERLSNIQLSTKYLQKYLKYTKNVFIFFLCSRQKQ